MSGDQAGIYDAVLGVLNAALPATRKAYRSGDPKILSEGLKTYTEVTVGRIYGGTRRNDASLGSIRHRILTRYVATIAANADTQLDKTRAALEYTALSIGGDTSTPVQFETDDPIGDDDGWFSGLDYWTFAL